METQAPVAKPATKKTKQVRPIFFSIILRWLIIIIPEISEDYTG
jgi:hypothetical protein